jgi:hypothetical protein
MAEKRDGLSTDGYCLRLSLDLLLSPSQRLYSSDDRLRSRAPRPPTAIAKFARAHDLRSRRPTATHVGLRRDSDLLRCPYSDRYQRA